MIHVGTLAVYLPTCRYEVYGCDKYHRTIIASKRDSGLSLATLLKRTSLHFHRTWWPQKPGQREAGVHEDWLPWLLVFTPTRLYLKSVMIDFVTRHAGIGTNNEHAHGSHEQRTDRARAANVPAFDSRLDIVNGVMQGEM